MSQAVKHVTLSMGFSAKVDMSSTASGPGPNTSFQYTAVKLDTTVDWQVDKAGAGDKGVGVLNNQPKLGSAAEVVLLGVSPMVVDGNASAIAPGDRLKIDASGRGIKTTTANDEVIAISLQISTAQNDIISVFVLGGSFKL